MNTILPRVLKLCASLILATTVFAAGSQEPGQAGLENFRRGANFGNYLEVPPGQTWAVVHTIEDIRAVKKQGFDHIRLPVGWQNYAGEAPGYKIKPEIFQKVDSIVTNSLNEGLAIIVNVHHFDAFTSDPDARASEFEALWRQIGEHYKSYPNKLAFELLNEPKDAATTEKMNAIYARVIPVIRETNPDRTLFVAPGRWNSLDEVSKLRLPESDRNLIVTVHSYEPFLFTHQGASWTGSATETTGIVYPGPPKTPVTPKGDHPNKKWFEAYNTLSTDQNPCGPKAFAGRMEKVAEWAQQHHRPVHVGEFGAYRKADQDSRARFYRDMRRTAERLGFGWAIWDWKAEFRYWDGSQPLPGMKEALFGK